MFSLIDLERERRADSMDLIRFAFRPRTVFRELFVWSIREGDEVQRSVSISILEHDVDRDWTMQYND